MKIELSPEQVQVTLEALGSKIDAVEVVIADLKRVAKKNDTSEEELTRSCRERLIVYQGAFEALENAQHDNLPKEKR